MLYFFPPCVYKTNMGNGGVFLADVPPSSSAQAHALAMKATLWIKIITTLFWAGGALFVHADYLAHVGFESGAAILVVRLLGVAFLSLLLGYSLGLHALITKKPNTLAVRNTVLVGILSNGGSALVLFWFGLTGRFTLLPSPLPHIFWASAVLTGGIALSLFLCGRDLWREMNT